MEVGSGASAARRSKLSGDNRSGVSQESETLWSVPFAGDEPRGTARGAATVAALRGLSLDAERWDSFGQLGAVEGGCPVLRRARGVGGRRGVVRWRRR